MKQSPSDEQEEETSAGVVPEEKMDSNIGSVQLTAPQIEKIKEEATHAKKINTKEIAGQHTCNTPPVVMKDKQVEEIELESEMIIKDEESDEDDDETGWETDVSRYLTTVMTAEGAEVVEEGAEGLPCELCGRKFRNKQGLSAHKNRIHYDTLLSRRRKPSYSVAASPELKCKFCRKQYVNRKSLLKHVKKEHLSNNGLGAYRCEECDKTFRLRNSLWMHRQSKHSTVDNKQLCEYCHRLLKSQRSYREHLLKKHPSAYLQREGARGARGAAAGGEAGGAGRVLGEAEAARLTRPHRCDTCGGEYVSATILRKHIASVHPPPDAERACPLCARTFKTELRLQGHLENKHSPLEERRKCEECGQVYKNKYSLQFHMKHTHGRRLPLGQGGMPCAPHEPLAARTRPRTRRRREDAVVLQHQYTLMTERHMNSLMYNTAEGHSQTDRQAHGHGCAGDELLGRSDVVDSGPGGPVECVFVKQEPGEGFSVKQEPEEYILP